MSTQINIRVDRGGLLQRNRQQTTANRQAATETQQQQRLKTDAEQQRQERLQLEQARRTRRRRTSFVREEPAANRLLASTLAMGPFLPPSVLPESDPTLNPQQRYFVLDSFVKRHRAYSADALIHKAIYFKTEDTFYDTPNRTTWDATYEAGAGPSGNNAIAIEIFTPWAGGADLRPAGCQFWPSYPTPQQNPFNLPISSYTYTTPQNTALGYGSRTIYHLSSCTPYLESYWADGVLPEYRLDLFYNWGPEDQDTPEEQAQLNKAWEYNGVPFTCEVFLKVTGDGSNPVYVDLRFGDVTLYIDGDANYFEVWSGSSYTRTAFSLDPRSMTSWTHVAVSGDGQAIRLFINGSQVATAAIGANQYLYADTLRLAPYAMTNVEYGTNKTYRFELHGYRISKKALYVANFTPPNGIR